MTSQLRSEERQIIGERDYRIEEVRTNEDLTPEAKQRRIDELHQWARQEIDAVREYEKQQREQRLEKARRDVFNVPTGPTGNMPTGAEQSQIWASFRSAYKDVLSATEDPLKAHETLQEIMDQAERTGDWHLARAAYHRGADLGLQQVIDRYHSTRRDEREKWENYLAAQQEINESQSFEHLYAIAQTERVLNS
jgi:hypothetical protein